MTAAYHHTGVFSIKNPTIESEVSWSSLLSFLHFRRTEFTTVAIDFQCMEKRNLMEVSGLVTHILQNIKVKQDMMEKNIG